MVHHIFYIRSDSTPSHLAMSNENISPLYIQTELYIKWVWHSWAYILTFIGIPNDNPWGWVTIPNASILESGDRVLLQFWVMQDSWEAMKQSSTKVSTKEGRGTDHIFSLITINNQLWSVSCGGLCTLYITKAKTPLCDYFPTSWYQQV